MDGAHVAIGTYLGTGTDHSIIRANRQPPSTDLEATGKRSVTASSATFRGLSVTATNSDDYATAGVSAGIAGTFSVNVGGAVNIVRTTTQAYIGASAHINSGNTSTEPTQGVRRRGEQYRQLASPVSAAFPARAPFERVSRRDHWTKRGSGAGDVEANGDIVVMPGARGDRLGGARRLPLGHCRRGRRRGHHPHADDVGGIGDWRRGRRRQRSVSARDDTHTTAVAAAAGIGFMAGGLASSSS
jgi:hypothetical protein